MDSKEILNLNLKKNWRVYEAFLILIAALGRLTNSFSQKCRGVMASTSACTRAHAATFLYRSMVG